MSDAQMDEQNPQSHDRQRTEISDRHGAGKTSDSGRDSGFPDRPYNGRSIDYPRGRRGFTRDTNGSVCRAYPSAARQRHGGGWDRDDDSREGLKRRPEGPPVEEQAEVKRRNRRLFGALIGTLQKFKKEENGAERAEISQRRAQLLEKAEAKTRRGQQQRYTNHHNTESKFQMSASPVGNMTVEQLEKWYTNQIARREKDNTYIRTRAYPCVLWAPARHNDRTLKLIERRQKETAVWKENLLKKLDVEKKQLMETQAVANTHTNVYIHVNQQQQQQDGDVQEQQTAVDDGHAPSAAPEQNDKSNKPKTGDVNMKQSDATLSGDDSKKDGGETIPAAMQKTCPTKPAVEAADKQHVEDDITIENEAFQLESTAVISNTVDKGAADTKKEEEEPAANKR